MKLTITITGHNTESLAQTLHDEVLRLVEEGYKTGYDENDTGSYSFDIEGWHDGETEAFNPIEEDDGQPDDEMNYDEWMAEQGRTDD